MTSSKTIQICTPSGILDFLDAGAEIFKNDKIWVEEKKRNFDQLLHSYFIDPNTAVKALVSVSNNRAVARGLAIVHQQPSKNVKEKTGWIGLIDFKQENLGVAKQVLTELEQWLISNGVKSVTGPKIDNTQAGLQVSGFNLPQTVLTNYNPDYYASLWEKSGYMPLVRMVSYQLTRESIISHKERTSKEFFIRTFNPDSFNEELKVIANLQKTTFSSRPDYLPSAFDYTLSELQKNANLLDPALVLIAEEKKHQIPIGVLICVPDIYQLYQEGTINRARIISIGAAPEYQKKGVGVLLTEKLKQNLLRNNNYISVEASWIRSTNKPALNLFKRYRVNPGREFLLYQKHL